MQATGWADAAPSPCVRPRARFGLTRVAAALRLSENLLRNTFRAMPDRITVRESGVGMDAATLGRAFEPFSTTKDKGHGSGLGLSMVYGIIRQSSGFLRAESRPG